MKSEILPDITSHIVEKAKEFGASLAGIADVEAVKNSPSRLLYGKLDESVSLFEESRFSGIL